jgi:hypothetical protein
MLIMDGEITCLVMKLHKACYLLCYKRHVENRCEINTKYFIEWAVLDRTNILSEEN